MSTITIPPNAIMVLTDSCRSIHCSTRRLMPRLVAKSSTFLCTPLSSWCWRCSELSEDVAAAMVSVMVRRPALRWSYSRESAARPASPCRFNTCCVALVSKSFSRISLCLDFSCSVFRVDSTNRRASRARASRPLIFVNMTVSRFVLCCRVVAHIPIICCASSSQRAQHDCTSERLGFREISPHSSAAIVSLLSVPGELGDAYPRFSLRCCFAASRYVISLSIWIISVFIRGSVKSSTFGCCRPRVGDDNFGVVKAVAVKDVDWLVIDWVGGEEYDVDAIWVWECEMFEGGWLWFAYKFENAFFELVCDTVPEYAGWNPLRNEFWLGNELPAGLVEGARGFWRGWNVWNGWDTGITGGAVGTIDPCWVACCGWGGCVRVLACCCWNEGMGNDRGWKARLCCG